MKVNLIYLIALVMLFANCSQAQLKENSTQKSKIEKSENNVNIEKITKSEAQWKLLLSEKEYDVTRQKGTERAFTGKFWDTKTNGIYVCKCCDLPLFDSNTKFKSGTGWPSFYQPVNKKYVGEIADDSFGWKRVEVVCNRCDAHLGHVFEDGPKPTGLRYCINSASLDFLVK